MPDELIAEVCVCIYVDLLYVHGSVMEFKSVNMFKTILSVCVPLRMTKSNSRLSVYFSLVVVLCVCWWQVVGLEGV